MENGYIKLWRKSMDSRIFANSQLWQLWTYCLMKANHKKQWVPMITGRGETEIEIQAGQFIFGRNTWAKKLKMKPSTLWYMMQKLERLEYLDMQSNNVCTIVTIRNWKVYQQREEMIGQPNGQRIGNESATNRQRTDTDKNDKNDKKNYSDRRKNFKKPSVEQITAYCNERGNSIDPIIFYNHYESKGWVVGMQPMKNWKAAIITWEKRNPEPKEINRPPKPDKPPKPVKRMRHPDGTRYSYREVLVATNGKDSRTVQIFDKLEDQKKRKENAKKLLEGKDKGE